MTLNIQNAYRNNCAMFVAHLNEPTFRRQVRSLLEVSPAPTTPVSLLVFKL